MIDRSTLETAIYAAIDKANQLALSDQVTVPNRDTVLLGEGASLDSMGFVNFAVALEDELASRVGLQINIPERLNARLGSENEVRTVDQLISYLVEQC